MEQTKVAKVLHPMTLKWLEHFAMENIILMLLLAIFQLMVNLPHEPKQIPIMVYPLPPYSTTINRREN